MAPTPPPTTAPSPPPATPEQLRALYDQALLTGDAAELVRELCRTLGVSLRGLAELTGIGHSTLAKWARGANPARPRTLRDVAPFLQPTKAIQKKVAATLAGHPLGRRGRPRSVS